mmetsp:Transcript_64344/g.192158  ORF Transcript_64344/g.192158 Transcript_64344/m.192158 type:complete len:234 (+) Transcript_64344:329-1030(+)
MRRPARFISSATRASRAASSCSAISRSRSARSAVPLRTDSSAAASSSRSAATSASAVRFCSAWVSSSFRSAASRSAASQSRRHSTKHAASFGLVSRPAAFASRHCCQWCCSYCDSHVSHPRDRLSWLMRRDATFISSATRCSRAASSCSAISRFSSLALDLPARSASSAAAASFARSAAFSSSSSLRWYASSASRFPTSAARSAAAQPCRHSPKHADSFGRIKRPAAPRSIRW